MGGLPISTSLIQSCILVGNHFNSSYSAICRLSISQCSFGSIGQKCLGRVVDTFDGPSSSRVVESVQGTLGRSDQISSLSNSQSFVSSSNQSRTGAFDLGKLDRNVPTLYRVAA